MPSATAIFSLPALCWLQFLLYAVVAVWVRDFLPVDETRYVTVAWEMWQSGDYWVPHLLGQPYSHKPPLLFWLIVSGWWVFGVVDWWPRLLPLVIALLNLFALRRLALTLWPLEPLVADLASQVLLGSTLWLIYSSLLLFDGLASLFVLLALAELAHWQRHRASGELGLKLGLWLGLGLLAKGPVIFVYVLPAALFLPAFGLRETTGMVWYRRLGVALSAGIALGLAWALPAAASGGADYARLILWGQVAGRVTQSFAHAEPWWWYLPWLPVLAWPWVSWPRSWLTGRAVMANASLPLLVLVSGFVTLSLVSGKQLHYLLPLVPVFAVVIARRLGRSETDRHGEPRARAAALSVVLLFALLLALCLGGLPVDTLPYWVADIPSAALLLGLLLGVLPLMGQSRPLRLRTLHVALTGWGTALVLQWAVIGTGAGDYQLRAVASLLHEAESSGRASLYLGGYAGEFNFIGRLQRGPETVFDLRDLGDWVARHPDGQVMRMFRGEPPAGTPPALHLQPYRGKRLGVWRAADIAHDPQLLDWLAH